MKNAAVLLSALLFAFVLGSTWGGSAQAQGSPNGEEYMMIVGTQGLMARKVAIELDYGQATRLMEDTRLRDDSGKVAKFNSMADAMNHMNESGGWVLHDAYAVCGGQGCVYNWVLRRPVQR